MLLLENVFYDQLSVIEQQLRLPDRFFRNIRAEDDWSFIIKIHALFEAAVSDQVCEKLNRPELKDVMSCLELSDSRRGKVAFADALGMLGDGTVARRHRGFIRHLSELRNKLAHDPRNVNFDLREDIDQLCQTDKRRLFVRCDTFSGNDDLIFERVFLVDPKTIIWWSAVATIAQIYDFNEIRGLQAGHLEFLRSLYHQETN